MTEEDKKFYEPACPEVLDQCKDLPPFTRWVDKDGIERGEYREGMLSNGSLVMFFDQTMKSYPKRNFKIDFSKNT